MKSECIKHTHTRKDLSHCHLFTPFSVTHLSFSIKIFSVVLEDIFCPSRRQTEYRLPEAGVTTLKDVNNGVGGMGVFSVQPV